jgi:tyrosinase
MPVIPVLQAGKPQFQILRTRRNADSLTPDQVTKLRGAWQASYGLNDDRGYAYFAGLHGLPLPIECVHNDTFWLPWHRAYLYYFEMSLRKLDPTVTLPWWNWGTGHMPASFTTPATNNPLVSAPIPPAAQNGGPAQSFRDGPGALPTNAQINAAIGRPDFLDFSHELRQLHNSVHVSFAGTMHDPETAAFDPIFWAHHTFVDRAWRLWQLNHSSAQFPASFLNQALAPFPMTVAQTMSVTALGYDYARSTISIPFAGNLADLAQPIGGTP